MKSTLSGEVIQLLNQKQKAAFKVVFSVYYPRLVGFAKTYVSYEDARNLVQDAFCSFWQKKPEVLSEYQLQSYLYSSVKNNCLMHLRREKVKKSYSEDRKIRLQQDLDVVALEKLDTSSLAFQEIEQIIEKTLNELPPRCREVFALSRMEGKKNQEVADELDISLKAVEAQITKALKALKVSLKDYLPLVAFILVV